jgi:TatD DNase family protein
MAPDAASLARSVRTDSHAHLSYVAERQGPAALAAVLGAYEAAWSLAAAEGRAGPLLLDAGVEAGDLGRRAALLGSPPFLRLAAGVWPGGEALDDPARALAELAASIAAHPGLVSALGEGGLDYHHEAGRAEAQRELFLGQLSLAARLGKAFLVHSREAAADSVAILREAGPACPVVIHCYGYGPRELLSFLDLGCHISFAGNLSYRNADELREALCLVPPDRLLLETDSPYLNPEPLRGRPATPLDIGRSYALAARLRGMPEEELARLVSANAHRLFG